MGATLNGILAYGFHLGGVEDWQFKDLPRFDDWRPSWATPEQLAEVDSGEFDYEAAITDRLAEGGLQLELVTVGMVTSDSSGLVLAAYSATATGGGVTSLHLPDIFDRQEIERWDEALSRALEVLDIRPWQPHPMMLLSQSYG